MAFEPFTWGAGGQKASPSSVKRQAEIAAALAARGGAPQNVGQGLNRVGEALLSNSMNSRADAGAAEGAASRKAVMDALMGNPDPTMADISGAMGNEWVTSDPGSSAILQALMGQELQQQDPLRQQQLQLGQIQLDQARNPQPEPGYRPMSPEDVSAYPNLDPSKSYQVGPNGEIKAIGGGGVNVSVGGASPTPGDDKFYETLGAESGKRFSAMIEQGSTARRNLTQLDIADDLMQSAAQGPMGLATLVAGKFGVDLGGLSETQALEAVVNKMIPAQREPGSGPMSDKDIDMYRSSVISVSNLPGGNALIIDTARAVNQYDIQIAGIAGKVEDGILTRAQAREEMSKVPNPIDAFREARKQLESGAGDTNGQPQAAPQATPTQSQAPTVNNEQEYNALPPGSPYMAPDGTMRIKGNG